MQIEKTKNGTELIVSLKGRMDTMTAPRFDADIKKSIGGMTALTLDLGGLDYISSAGLRSLALVQKLMDKQGSMKVIHANEDVMDVFNVTGFTEILTIVA